MKGFLNFLDKKYGELVFGLLCGSSYFVIALNFIFANTKVGGALLASFLSPVIICGIALVFIKTIRLWKENEQHKKIFSFVIAHLIILLIAIVFVIDFLINGIA